MPCVLDPFAHLVRVGRAGYGWSEAPLAPGYDVQKVANLMVSLMETLGYKQYVAQGGDWGHLVAAHMAIIDAQRCLAIHLNMVPLLFYSWFTVHWPYR